MVVFRLAFVPPAVPSLVHFSWSFPVNWYIQSISLYPRNQVSHIRISFAHSLAQLLTALPNLSIPAGGTDYPPQALAHIH